MERDGCVLPCCLRKVAHSGCILGTVETPPPSNGPEKHRKTPAIDSKSNSIEINSAPASVETAVERGLTERRSEAAAS